MAVWDGRRSAIPEDLNPADLDALSGVLAEIQDAEFRARVADVLWVCRKDYKAAQTAVDAYIESSRGLESGDKWRPQLPQLPLRETVSAGRSARALCTASMPNWHFARDYWQLKAACIGPDATTFETRFGFRHKQPLIRFRLLDPGIAASARIPFADFAIPVDAANKLSINTKNVLVVENEMTFLTLPPLTSTVALLGAGDAVSHLRQLAWLTLLRVVYWGDMDTHGFHALSLLRSHHPHTESVMMDVETYNLFRQFLVRASGYSSRSELHLSKAEDELFRTLRAEGKLLEQERIPLGHVRDKLRASLS